MLRSEAMEVFDGVMLGDGGLRHTGRSALMSVSKSGIQYMPYLTHLRDTLSLLGVEPCTDHPKNFERVSRERPYTCCELKSHVSPFLFEQRRRWYPNGKKIIPSDVRITPISMAYEFMDDGSTSWVQGNRVLLRLYTNCFSKEEVYHLRDLVTGRFGVYFYPYLYSGWGLTLRKTEEVNLFLEQIEEYVLPCYKYKVKRPQYKSVRDRLEAEERARQASTLRELNSLRRKIKEGVKYEQS